MEEDSDEESAPLESRIRKREKRRKCRTPEEMETDTKLDWVESIPFKGFKIERQVNRRSSVNDIDIIILLENQEGDLVNFSRVESIDSDAINNDMYTTILSVWVPPHKPGKFKDIYKVLDQVVHYNLYPRGIVDFKGDTFGTARCPYLCMITAFLREKGVSKGPNEKLEQPSPVVITQAVLVKSKSQSKAVGAGTSAGPSAPSAPLEPSLWSIPNPKASKESIWRKLCCQNIAIWNDIQKEKKERKKLAREVGELKHELDWHT
ncbi:hypothetical protein RHSIM_Rhsim12G0095600 [Rhododendron simsii]|uniref:Uncharacterized protein n=1 Tax=Rhododendron simsii TaxID=118357 RepID=A0A834G1I7_RHOSS|nr:hypothetical protein RHSIM_Rhsim12G0095600 [Rhododendron simsii]